MSRPARTIADAQTYWERYYDEEFVAGLGTETVLDALAGIPPVGDWTDLGSGSESLLWAIALHADRLTAVDIDPARLSILTTFAASEQPRGVHRAVLQRCRRAPEAFADRCRSLTATVEADCLTGQRPAPTLLPAASCDLLTQFGLLGLCHDEGHFLDCFTAAHTLLRPGGWAAGANWVARDGRGRVALTRQLYEHAARTSGLHLSTLTRAESRDPEFAAVWTYTARRPTP